VGLKETSPEQAPVLRLYLTHFQARWRNLRKNFLQQLKKVGDPGPDYLGIPGRREISFEREILGLDTFTAEIKEKSAEGFMGRRGNMDGYLKPLGFSIPG